MDKRKVTKSMIRKKLSANIQSEEQKQATDSDIDYKWETDVNTTEVVYGTNLMSNEVATIYLSVLKAAL